MELDPSGKHIALGSDFDGCERLPLGINGIQDYPKLANRLLERGLSTATVYDIFWNNALEVFKRCCM
jgi:membrane dipeptidase